MKLEGKVAIVTGGGRGIGRGIALALAEEGADIAVVEADVLDSAFNQYSVKEINGYPSAQEVAEEVKALGRRAIAIKADVTKWDQVQAAVKQTIDELGQVDILVNNAGVISIAPVEAMEEEAWDIVMGVNAKGLFLCSKAVIPHMKQRGGGKIINTASIAGKNGFGTLVHYTASKFAAVGFTNALAKELAGDNITVNAICPGIVATQMWMGSGMLADAWKQPGESIEESYKRTLGEIIPQGVDQTPEDMGALAVYFATSDHVTGQAHNVDGGTELH
jgi:meso-butanediol dehydrogenase/(S,S)-butanediol dehydrogenase/diacetyl reductase